MTPVLLIADGDGELSELYAMFFAECGFEVETSAGGVDCLVKLRRLRPAVLLLDRELPWGGGDGILAWLREQRPDFGVAVVLTTRAECRRDLSGEVWPPVVGVLRKPFAPGRLLEAVRAAARGIGEEPQVVGRGVATSERVLG